MANRLLETHLPPLAVGSSPRGGDSPWRQVVATVTDSPNLRQAVHLVLKLPVTVVALIAGGAPLVLTAGLLVLGVQGIGGLGGVDDVGPFSLGVPAGIVLLLFAVPSAILTVAILDGLHGGLRTLTASLLVPRTAPSGPVRELLAQSLGDATVSVAYWLPDRETFVDEAGHPVELPDIGSGRAWTAVERDGRRVAAIVHDAALDTGPELVNAAASAAALAIDNERLKADLRARVEELRESRLRIVEAGDEARRRLERDLHDGAQQQLVSLALDLRLLKAKVGDEDAARMVDAMSEKLGAALAELRELARGIHPAILTDQGLAAAIDALANRAPLPVESEVDVEERLPAPVEAAAYFLVAEALTNVVKYARATVVHVAISRSAGGVDVLVEDDGIGGADLSAGTGLRGLQDRVAALDGTLAVDSPPGGGTRLRAHMPVMPEPGTPAPPSAVTSARS
jgi:signal transduction histidine kinase